MPNLRRDVQQLTGLIKALEGRAVDDPVALKSMLLLMEERRALEDAAKLDYRSWGGLRGFDS